MLTRRLSRRAGIGARIRLIARGLVSLALGSAGLAPGPVPAAESVQSVADLARINAALQTWLEVVEEDALHLVFDRQEASLRLQHGGGLLRVCPVLADSLGEEESTRQTLSSHLRTYRRHHAYAQPGPGPFDWEYYLVADASEECALSFSGGLLIYSSDSWKDSGAPSLQIAAADVRALYNSLQPGTPFIILPAGWNRTTDTGE